MYGSLLSLLLMGFFPVFGNQAQSASLPQLLDVASPAPQALRTVDFDTLSLSASGVLIVDAESLQTLTARNVEATRPMASLTKLMTALIIVENHDLDEWVRIPSVAAGMPGSRAGLPAGESYTVGDLLSVLLVGSANDAATALAIYHSGTTGTFANVMNERAAELGLRNTQYENPAGYDDDAQYSSVRDTAILAIHAWRHPAIAERMSMPQVRIEGLNGTAHTMAHTHQMLRSGDADIVAGKTGTTDNARECLLSFIRDEQGKLLLVVLMGSGNRYADLGDIVRFL